MLGIMIISILGYGTFFEIVHIEWKCITQPLSQRRCLGNVKFMITAVYIVITYDECVYFHGAFILLPMLQVRTWMFLLLQPPISCIGWEFPITATKAILCLLGPINQRHMLSKSLSNLSLLGRPQLLPWRCLFWVRPTHSHGSSFLALWSDFLVWQSHISFNSAISSEKFLSLPQVWLPPTKSVPSW